MSKKNKILWAFCIIMLFANIRMLYIVVKEQYHYEWMEDDDSDYEDNCNCKN